MARKAETTKKEPKKTIRKKVEKVAEPVKEVNPLEITYIYHEGDNLPEIAKAMTGHAYLMGKILMKNGKTTYDLKDGDVLKW